MDTREITSVKVIIPFFVAIGNAAFLGTMDLLIFNRKKLTQLWMLVKIDVVDKYFKIATLENKKNTSQPIGASNVHL